MQDWILAPLGVELGLQQSKHGVGSGSGSDPLLDYDFAKARGSASWPLHFNSMELPIL